MTASYVQRALSAGVQRYDARRTRSIGAAIYAELRFLWDTRYVHTLQRYTNIVIDILCVGIIVQTVRCMISQGMWGQKNGEDKVVSLNDHKKSGDVNSGGRTQKSWLVLLFGVAYRVSRTYCFLLMDSHDLLHNDQTLQIDIIAHCLLLRLCVSSVL